MPNRKIQKKAIPKLPFLSGAKYILLTDTQFLDDGAVPCNFRVL